MKDWMPRSGDQTRKMHASQATGQQHKQQSNRLIKTSQNINRNFFGLMVVRYNALTLSISSDY
jgi:hypothetical protein